MVFAYLVARKGPYGLIVKLAAASAQSEVMSCVLLYPLRVLDRFCLFRHVFSLVQPSTYQAYL